MTLRLRFLSVFDKKRTKNPVSYNNSVSWPSLVLFFIFSKSGISCFIPEMLRDAKAAVSDQLQYTVHDMRYRKIMTSSVK